MATLYKRAGTHNWTDASAWSLSSGGPADAGIPTTSDDVFLDAASGDLNITSASSICRSMYCAGYTGAVVQSANFTLDGSSTLLPAHGYVLLLSAGMTYTRTSGTLNITHGGGAIMKLDLAGKTIGGTGQFLIGNFSGGSCRVELLSDLLMPSTLLSLRQAWFRSNGYDLSLSQLIHSQANNANIIDNLTGSILTLSSNSTTNRALDFEGQNSLWVYDPPTETRLTGANSYIRNATGRSNLAVGDVFYPSTGGTLVLSVNLSLSSLNATGSGNRTISLDGSTSITNVVLTGDASRILIQSNTVGTPRTITCNGTITASNVDFQDITGAGSASWDLSAITGGSGDCGGNSGITFTTATTQDITMSTSKNWNDVTIWTSRVPLPQDDVTATGWTGGTLTVNMPRMGRNIDLSGASSGVTLNFSVAYSVFGSFIFNSSLTRTGTPNASFITSGTSVFQMNGRTFGGNLSIRARTGASYTMLDAFTCSGTLDFFGRINTDGYSITGSIINISQISADATIGATIFNMTITSASTVFTNTGSANVSLATLVIATTSTNTRTVNGGGNTYTKLRYIISGSTGGFDITGSPTFVDGIEYYDATATRGALRFTAGTTTTITNGEGWDVRGRTGVPLTVTSITGANHNIVCTNGQLVSDFLNLSRSQLTGVGYAGANSTDGGDNTGWIFTAPGGWRPQVVMY